MVTGEFGSHVSSSDFQGEEFTQNEKFTLDGKESKNEGFQGMERISMASWTADGKSLEIKI